MGTGRRYFTKQTPANSFLINKFFFTIGNMALKQDTGIPICVDPAPIFDQPLSLFLRI